MNLSNVFGIISKITANSIEISGLRPSIGDVVHITSGEGRDELGMVTQIYSGGASVSPFGFVEGFHVGDKVFASDRGMQIPVGDELLGRGQRSFGTRGGSFYESKRWQRPDKTG